MGRNPIENEKNRAKSRAAILTVAKKSFAETGYLNCKMSDIAKLAGMSYGNVYWYFPTKEDLLKAILDEGFAQRDTILKEASAMQGNSLEKVGYIVDRYIELYRNNSEFTALYTSLLASGGPEFFKSIGFDPGTVLRGQDELLLGIFRLAIQQKTVINISPETLSSLFLSFFNGIMLTYRNNIDKLPPAEIRNSVLRLIGQESVFYV